MREVLEYYKPNILASKVLTTLNLKHSEYILVSIHREENVDNHKVLLSLVNTLNRLAENYSCQIIVSTHPRTKNRIKAIPQTEFDERIVWMKPFGFHDYNRLQISAKCVISDSGTIAEESSILNFSAVTPRFSIERPEAMDTGAIVACGYEEENVLRAVDLVIKQNSLREDGSTAKCIIPDSYSIYNTSQRVVNLICGTARLSNAWDGIRSNDSNLS